MKKALFIILFGTIIASCSDKPKPSSKCDYDTIVDTNIYENTISDGVEIQQLSIKGDCMTITYAAGGCDGSSWKIQLLDSGVVNKSIPLRRGLKFTLTSTELCEAYITKESSFDISNLQVEGYSKVLLQVGDKSILYQY